MTEVQAILLSGSGFMVVNVVGWIVTSYRSNNKHLQKQIDDLPCVADKTYERTMGALFSKVESIDERLERMETAQNGRVT